MTQAWGSASLSELGNKWQTSKGPDDHRLELLQGTLDMLILGPCRVDQARVTRMMWLKVEPDFESVHDDPRFEPLLRRIRLTS